jgi:ABC-type uncharacterized transport system substrate-binding protein
MVRKISIFAVLLTFLVGSTAFAADYSGKKVLYIDSYHAGYPWSDGITEGVQDALKGSGVELKIIHMDTKRNKQKEQIEQAALVAKGVIESFRPDVVIAADDNASKFLVMPYYKNASLPFVFCGLNWDASNYGYPYSNATGMVEVALIEPLLNNMKSYAKGDKIGYLSSDVLSSTKEAVYYKKLFGISFAEEKHVGTFADWKAAFKEMHENMDMVIVGNNSGIPDWNEAEALAWAQANTKVVSGTVYDFLTPLSVMGLTKVAQEQGIWSGKTALEILDGKSPSSIPIVQNKKGEIFANVQLAAKAGVVFKPAMIRTATVIK